MNIHKSSSPKKLNIHSTAIVSENAQIGEGTSIGAYSIISDNVIIGKDNIIASHVVIEGKTIIGDNNHIFQFSSIGSIPQDLKYQGEDTHLIIGNSNTIREYVTLQPGTLGGGSKTSVGNSNLFMASTHVGHDCVVGDQNIFANSAGLSGHVVVGNKVTVGGLSGIHQFVTLGDLSFLGGGCMVTKDVAPFCIAQGDRAGLAGINVIGLERNGSSVEEINSIRRLYKTLFINKKGTFKERLEELLNNDKNELEQKFLEFVKTSKRGVMLPRQHGNQE